VQREVTASKALCPASEAELAEAIASAEGPLRILGGGTRAYGRPVEGRPLTTAALTGITLYEPGALTLVVRAGTPLADVEAALAEHGQRLPFEPMDMRGLLGTEGAPTIGGVAAANVSGPRRVQVGACRDYMLGVRLIDGRGEIIKSGGRVMKNVTGYDLVKLMAGSHGTLGVLTEISFKVLPEPEARAVLLVEGLDDATAQRAMTAALNSPFEVSGAAHAPRGVDGAPVTMIRIEGFAGSVRYRTERLKEILSRFGEVAVETDPERTAAGWRWVRDVEAFHDRPGDVWRLSLKPSEAPEVAARAEPEGALYDWGGGRLWLLMPEGTDLRARLGPFSGHATLIRASEPTRRAIASFPPQPAPVAALEAGIRRQFDPRGILNPGLMG
jgi:glycolate oxidase FAD binding subunit